MSCRCNNAMTSWSQYPRPPTRHTHTPYTRIELILRLRAILKLALRCCCRRRHREMTDLNSWMSWLVKSVVHAALASFRMFFHSTLQSISLTTPFRSTYRPEGNDRRNDIFRDLVKWSADKVWYIPFADKRVGVQVKVWELLTKRVPYLSAPGGVSLQ